MKPTHAALFIASYLGILLWPFPSQSELYPYAQRGPISQGQFDQVVAQGIPASYDQVVSLLGSPAWRSEAQDLYQMPDGRWLAISYNGTTAVSMAIRDVPIEPTPRLTDRWSSGEMSWEQFNALQHLGWPQSGADMEGTFGSPAYRIREADYYRLPDGRYAVVWYTFQNRAFGYAVQDSI
jgi:hypothetical protein